jgi:hypothetical protein
VRWLGGKREARECWDAYEAVDGVPIDDAVTTRQPWSRVRHWIDDLAREIAAGLKDGSLPPLQPESVWIGRDDRARIVEWRRSHGELSRIAGEAGDWPSAQRLLYGVAIAALLGVPVQEATNRPPAAPLPLHARTLLLSLRDGKFSSADALLEAVSAALGAPAAFSRAHRGGQIAVSAAFPLLMAMIAVGGIVWVGKNRATMPDAAEALSLVSWTGLWVVALASAAGSFGLTMFFSALGALVTGSGCTFRPFGAALVNARGQRASRLRALWRAAVTWTPIGVTLIVVKLSPDPPHYRVDLLVLETALMAFVAGAAAWAVSHPSRSVQDRLAGTWVVPR